MSITTDDIRRYYEEMTEAYLRYGGSTFGWHIGLAEDPEASHEEALLRADDLITRGLGLNPESQVIDCGCGVGGLAFYIAENFGSRVLGLTLSEQHVAIASAEAERRGVGHLVQFRVHDFAEPLSESPTCDVVLSQDAFCHADDKSEYLRHVFQALRPGGVWRAFDAFLTRDAAESPEPAWSKAVRDGWKVERFPQALEVREMMVDSGFREVAFMDVTTQAYPSARGFLTAHLGLEVLDKLGAERPSGWDSEGTTFMTHMAGNAAWAAGLLAGDICYGMLEGERPHR